MPAMPEITYSLGEVIDERNFEEYRNLKVDIEEKSEMNVELKLTTDVDIIGNKYILKGLIISFHPDEIKNLIHKLEQYA